MVSILIQSGWHITLSKTSIKVVYRRGERAKVVETKETSDRVKTPHTKVYIDNYIDFHNTQYRSK